MNKANTFCLLFQKWFSYLWNRAKMGEKIDAFTILSWLSVKKPIRFLKKAIWIDISKIKWKKAKIPFFVITISIQINAIFNLLLIEVDWNQYCSNIKTNYLPDLNQKRHKFFVFLALSFKKLILFSFLMPSMICIFYFFFPLY